MEGHDLPDEKPAGRIPSAGNTTATLGRMARSHTYETVVTWTGNRGTGTSGYRDYSRDHDVAAAGRADIAGSSDPAFRGDRSRWNPEQLLVAALAQCHLLWYLHLCADAGVVVTGYVDRAGGTMTETGDTGHFTEVVLRPEVTVASPDMVEPATRLHADAHRACYIANSVNFPVRHEPTVVTAAAVTP
jgi:organic hydroperoxide reductase OsmC/OhrA